MNIHISESEFKEIEKHTLLKIVVGSHLYMINNEHSDKDILYITNNLEKNLHSLVQLHHQYQYKGNNTDYLLCSLQNFIKNSISGDSTINFEALFSDEIKNHKDLSFLYNFRKNFYNYNLIRSYLGLCRRDLKAFKKENNNKKLFHALRGLMTAKILIDEKEYSNDFAEMDAETAVMLNQIKNNQLSQGDYIKIYDQIVDEVDSLRKNLNTKLETKAIHRIMSLDKIKELDQWLINYSMQTTKQGLFINDQYYAALQEDVKYEN